MLHGLKRLDLLGTRVASLDPLRGPTALESLDLAETGEDRFHNG
jgi:hypothetical protein